MNLEDYDFDRLLGLGYTEKATGELKNACWKGYTAVGTKNKGGRTVPNCVPISKSKSDHAEVSEGRVSPQKTKRHETIAGPSAGPSSFSEGEDETLDFAAGRGKPCGASHIPAGNTCHVGSTPVAPVPPKSAMTKKDPVAAALRNQQELKDFHRRENARVAELIKAGKVKGVDAAALDRVKAKKADDARKEARQAVVAQRREVELAKRNREEAAKGDDKKAAAEARRKHIEAKKKLKELMQKHEEAAANAGHLNRFGREMNRYNASDDELKNALASGKLNAKTAEKVRVELAQRAAHRRAGGS